MDTPRLLDCLAADYELLRGAATTADSTAPVPSCPGWTMRDLVSHVGQVYLHKVAAMNTGQWPDPWPTEAMIQEAPMALLTRGYTELTAEFSRHAPEDEALTWYEPDQTVGFWIRRMAQETVIHRMDAQLAAGVAVTEAPDDLAVDGIDEVLRCFLAYAVANWPADFAKFERPDGPGTIVVTVGQQTVGQQTVGQQTAGQHSWTLRTEQDKVTVIDGAAESPQVTVSASPDGMLRWLWGRADDQAIASTGDPAWAAYLRQLLVESTQ